MPIFYAQISRLEDNLLLVSTQKENQKLQKVREYANEVCSEISAHPVPKFSSRKGNFIVDTVMIGSAIAACVTDSDFDIQSAYSFLESSLLDFLNYYGKSIHAVEQENMFSDFSTRLYQASKKAMQDISATEVPVFNGPSFVDENQTEKMKEYRFIGQKLNELSAEKSFQLGTFLKNYWRPILSVILSIAILIFVGQK